MLEPAASNPADFAVNPKGSLSDLIRVERSGSEAAQNEASLDAYNPNLIGEAMKEALAEGFQVPSSSLDKDDTQERLDTITQYLMEELGVVDPQLAIKAVLKLAQDTKTSGDNQRSLLENIHGFIKTSRSVRKFLQENKKYGQYGINPNLNQR